MSSQIETETIALWLSTRSLDSFVNHTMLTKPSPEGEIRFNTQEHQQLFAVLLQDFFERVDESFAGVEGSCLDLLSFGSKHASFDRDGSARDMEAAVGALSEWLAGSIAVKVNLTEIEEVEELTLSRKDLLRICGNASKHNLGRLTRVAGRFQKILKKAGFEVDNNQAVLALEDFYSHLQDDVFNYYSIWLVQLLNDVRWGVHTYLTPVFEESFQASTTDPVTYSYRYPEGVADPLARRCFWKLMNMVRTGPSVSQFVANPTFRIRYVAISDEPAA